MQVKIRRSQLSDVPLLNTFQRALAVFESPFTPTINNPKRTLYYNLSKLIGSRKAVVLIAEKDSRVIGCGLARIQKNPLWSIEQYRGYVECMFVKPAFRQQGVGKQIMRALLAWLKKRKIRDIRLEVYARNRKAIRAYKQLGFTEHIIEMGL